MKFLMREDENIMLKIEYILLLSCKCLRWFQKFC